MKQIVVTCFLLVVVTGCAGSRATLPAEYPAQSLYEMPPQPQRTAGSLWNGDQNGLFSDMKARQVGDILTVAIYERASASKEAKTSTARESSMQAGLTNLFGLEDNIGNINTGIDPTQLLNTSYANDFEGEGKTSRKEDLVATLTTQVVGVTQGGNLIISGHKTVNVNYEEQIIELSGIVRPADISPRNVVDSKNILDARINYTGKGVISDKQKQGWLVRVLDNVWPF